MQAMSKTLKFIFLIATGLFLSFPAWAEDMPTESTGFTGKWDWVGKRKPWNYNHAPAPTSDPIEGQYVDRFEIRAGDCGNTHGWSDDCTHDREHIAWQEWGKTPQHKEVWYSFSVLFPKETPTDIGKDTNFIIFEVRPYELGQIDFALQMWQGFLYATVGSVSNKQTDGMHPPEDAADVPVDQIVPGVWRHYILNAVWSNGSDGKIRLYNDKGSQLFSFDRANTPFPNNLHVQYGIYRSFVSKYGKPLPTQVIYMDGVHKANSEAELKKLMGQP